MDTFQQLSDRVKPLIRAYESDLEHDRAIIARNVGVPFLHWTGESGTHIVMLISADSEFFPKAGQEVPYLFGHSDRNQLAGKPLEFAQAMGKFNYPTVHYFDGYSLHKITQQRAEEIARIYRAHCLDQFRRAA